MKRKFRSPWVKFVLLLLLVGVVSNNFAQQTCSKINSLIINTGYDPVNGTLLSSQADPYWQITNLSSAIQSAAGPISIPHTGFIIPQSFTPTGWYDGTSVNGGSAWISCTSSGDYPTLQDSNDHTMTITRTFRNCHTDTYTFDIGFADDNYALSVNIDNGPNRISPQSNSTSATNYASLQFITPFSQVLSPGFHTISITVQNLTYAQDEPTNWFGVNVNGTITGTFNSIVSPASQDNCNCIDSTPSNCSDSCYWKVTGNSIANGNNILGTLSNHDIKLTSNNIQRGVIQANGFFGYKTVAPTTTFHVYCENPVTDIPSGLRFENLPIGDGSVLVVDKEGYVYRKDPRAVKENEAPKHEIQDFSRKIKEIEQQNLMLRSEINSLRNQVTTLSSTLIKAQPANSFVKTTLYQNKPNPFSKETTIECFVSFMKSSAFIKIYDLTGKELHNFKLNNIGTNLVRVNSHQFPNGMYLYSLIVDNEEIDTKKMVVSQN